MPVPMTDDNRTKTVELGPVTTAVDEAPAPTAAPSPRRARR
jgi:hypothetical protein